MKGMTVLQAAIAFALANDYHRQTPPRPSPDRIIAPDPELETRALIAKKTSPKAYRYGQSKRKK